MDNADTDRARRLGNSEWLVTDMGRFHHARPSGSAELRAEADAALIREMERSLEER